MSHWKSETNADYGNFKRDFDLARAINTLASLRRAEAPEGEAFETYVRELSRFTEEVLRVVFHKLATQEIRRGFPTLPFFLALCYAEREKQQKAAREAHGGSWSHTDYVLVQAFNRWMEEEVAAKRTTRQEIFAKHPGPAKLWLKWRKDLEMGIFLLPVGWCDRCEGSKHVVWFSQGDQETAPERHLQKCPDCNGGPSIPEEWASEWGVYQTPEAYQSRFNEMNKRLATLNVKPPF